MIAMQVSLYPLGENDIKERLDIFWNLLKKENINFKVSPLSTIAWSDDEDKLFNTVYSAYKEVRKTGKVVMVSTTTAGTEEEIKILLNYL
jgi:uncharacterized protein YqgV (UPF0045/DUF77 family)